MTIQEIAALRRSGHLAEATEAAEKEFARNANKFTAGALFWCLNDQLKNQSAGDVAAIVERMKSLYNDHCPEDEYMQKSLASAERLVLPHYLELKQALENAKQGADAIAPQREFSSYYDSGELAPQLYPDFGWLTYYALKQTAPDDANKRKNLLNLYLKLDLPMPSVLHSLILGEAVKVEKNTPLQFRIRDFVRIWGLENLRDEDWEQFHTEGGNTMQSLVEKLISVYAKELTLDRVAAPEEFSLLVDKALEAFPKSQFLPQHKATVLISQGKAGEALKYYREMILKAPSKFYLWSQAADLVPDTDTKIGLLCKALSCGAEEEFIGKVRLKLAVLLLEKGMPANARYELEKYRHTYESRQWGLNWNFRNLYNRVASVEAAPDNDAIYSEYSANADEFIYSAIPSILAIKVGEFQSDDRNRPGRKITGWSLRTENATLRLWKPFKYGLDRRTPNGTAFEIKVRDEKIVWIKPYDGPVNMPWLKEQSGVVHLRTDRNGNPYTMISGTYVGEKLLQGVGEGQQIRILSAERPDGRWSALCRIQ